MKTRQTGFAKHLLSDVVKAIKLVFATIFLAPHHNIMHCITILMVVHIMLKVYRESEVSGKKVR